MNSLQILNILKTDWVMQTMYTGVYPIDELPMVFTKPAALVINMDSSQEPGSHWVAVYFDSVKDTAEYFDSYGQKPCQEIENFMNKHALKTKFNKKCVQGSITSTCGQWCIYFLIWRCRGIPLSSIVKSMEVGFSDKFVTKFINNLYKVRTHVIDSKFIYNQIS